MRVNAFIKWAFIRFFCSLALVLPALVSAAACGKSATAISDVQGTKDISALAGQTVTVEGVLTQDSRQPGGFAGFYLQQADTPRSTKRSSALFVYTRHPGGRPGQRLRVTGKVKEHYGLTELVAISDLRVCGTQALPAPVLVSLPWTRPPESLENMRIQLSAPLKITDSYQLARFGEITLAAADPVITTEFMPPGTEAYRQAEMVAFNTIILDDGHARQNPTALIWLPSYTATNPGSASANLAAGSEISGLTGVLDYRYGAWRLQPDQPPDIKASTPSERAPARPAGTNLRVMTLNLNNLFNGDGRGQGFPTARGAKTPAQYQRQLQRLSAGLIQADADVLALSELENDGYDANSSIAQLAATLGPHWRFVVPAQKSTHKDAIRTGLLYRDDRVNALGSAHYLASNGRPAITQRFASSSGGQTVRLVSVHLKSKSCRNAGSANANQNDGQGCYNARRIKQASGLQHQLKQLGGPDEAGGILITGDFNSYSMEQPIRELTNAGYTNMVAHFHPCTPARCEHYSYRFKGARGSLDHALASAPLKPRVLSARVWNINADQPRIIDYRHHASPTPWRSSDHNPLIIDLKL